MCPPSFCSQISASSDDSTPSTALHGAPGCTPATVARSKIYCRPTVFAVRGSRASEEILASLAMSRRPAREDSNRLLGSNRRAMKRTYESNPFVRTSGNKAFLVCATLGADGLTVKPLIDGLCAVKAARHRRP